MNDFEPLINLLTGKFGWLTTILIWIGALRLPMKLVNAWLQKVLTGFVARVAASPELDDDDLVRRFIGSLGYRITAFILDAILSLKLPTSETLDNYLKNPERPRVSGLAAFTVLGSLSFLLFAGCASGPQRPPSAFEAKFFNIETNYVDVVRLVTNTVVEVAPTGVLETNEVVATATNQEPVYAFEPGAKAAAVQQTATAIGNATGGYGGIVGAGIGGLFVLWATWRSRSKARSAAESLVQTVEVGRQILKSIPDGAKYEQQWKNWMVKHQAETEIIGDVSRLVAEVVDTEEAKETAKALVEIINAQKS